MNCIIFISWLAACLIYITAVPNNNFRPVQPVRLIDAVALASHGAIRIGIVTEVAHPFWRQATRAESGKKHTEKRKKSLICLVTLSPD